MNNSEIYIINAITGEKVLSPLTFEVAQKDFPSYMSWNKANELCEQLGQGWRLPTTNELEQLYTHRVILGGFTKANYWSSEENGGSFAFSKGFKWYSSSRFVSKFSKVGVRAIRNASYSNNI